MLHHNLKSRLGMANINKLYYEADEPAEEAKKTEWAKFISPDDHELYLRDFNLLVEMATFEDTKIIDKLSSKQYRYFYDHPEVS